MESILDRYADVIEMTKKEEGNSVNITGDDGSKYFVINGVVASYRIIGSINRESDLRGIVKGERYAADMIELRCNGKRGIFIVYGHDSFDKYDDELWYRIDEKGVHMVESPMYFYDEQI